MRTLFLRRINVINIRKLQSADKDVYVSMVKTFYSSEAVLHEIPDSFIESTFSELMDRDTYAEGFIFEDGAKAVGYGLISKTFSQEAGGMVVWVEEVYIGKAYRSKGIGTAFFSFLEENYPAARYRLETEPDNDSAARLYGRLGYKKLGYVSMIKGN